MSSLCSIPAGDHESTQFLSLIVLRMFLMKLFFCLLILSLSFQMHVSLFQDIFGFRCQSFLFEFLSWTVLTIICLCFESARVSLFSLSRFDCCIIWPSSSIAIDSRTTTNWYHPRALCFFFVFVVHPFIQYVLENSVSILYIPHWE